MSCHAAPPVLPGPPALVPPAHPRKARVTVPAQEARVRCLRAAAVDLLTRWRLPEDERDAAVLIVGELAANAAVHGRSEMSLCLILHRGRLCIALSDRGEPAPAPSRQPSEGDGLDEHGRGLGIVHALATHVDVRHDQYGASVMAWLAVQVQRTA